MVSEDSDQLGPWFSPVHRLSELSDLDEAGRRRMSTSVDQLHTPCERLEVEPLRRP